MKLRTTLLSVTLSFASLVLTPALVFALSRQEISQEAEAVTVRISHRNAPNEGGSGVIIGKNGNRYTVLTNCHVIPAADDSKIAPSQYRLFPYGSNRTEGYEFEAISECESFREPADSSNISWQVDMVVLQFNSSENFAVADLAETASNRAETIYVAGYPQRNGRVETQANFRFDTGSITGIIRQNRQGYEIVHNASTRPGMSGGPIFNQQGKLVALNGITQPDLSSLQQDYYGIPVRLYREWQRNNRLNRNETILSTSSLSQNPDIIAEKVIVKIDTPAGTGGSGVIFERNDNYYTIFTNCHVMQQGGTGTYRLTTYRRSYTLNITNPQSLCYPNNVDLARLSLKTEDPYTPVTLAEFAPRRGQRVMAVGFPDLDGTSSVPELKTNSGEITRLNSQPLRGYDIVHSADTFQGMSGGGLFNEQGELIAINGETRSAPDVGLEAYRFYSISISLFGRKQPNEELSASSINQEDAYTIAERVVVKIDTPTGSGGSGVIIERDDNRYTIVTNCHVLQSGGAGTYRLTTHRQRTYSINITNPQSLCYPNDVDLANFTLVTNDTYTPATFADSISQPGQRVVVAGFPALDGTNAVRDLEINSGEITQIASQPRRGYDIIYSAETFQGMQGGGIFNEQGELIAISGEALLAPDVQFYGISMYQQPSNTSLK